MTERKSRGWDRLLIGLSVVLFLSALAMYLTDAPLHYLLPLLGGSGLEPVGKVGALHGVLRRELPNDSSFTEVRQDGRLYRRDTVMTGADSSATLLLDDGNSIELGPKTMVYLDSEGKISLDGVHRLTRVELVEGQVIGKSAKRNLVVHARNQEFIVTEQAARKFQMRRRKPQELLADAGVQAVTKSVQPVRPAPQAVGKKLPDQATADADVLLVGDPEPLSSVMREIPETSAPPVSQVPSSRPKETPSPAVLAQAPSPSPEPSGIWSPVAAAIASPTPAVSRHGRSKIEILEPRDHSVISLDASKSGLKGRVGLRWKVSPPGAQLSLFASTVSGAGAAEPRKLKLPLSNKQGFGESAWLPAGPGAYKLEIVEQTPAARTTPAARASVHVTVEGEFQGINMLDPLVGGRKMMSNRFLGGPIQSDFQIKLGWQAYPGVREYLLRVSGSSDMSHPFVTKRTPHPEYVLTRESGDLQRIFYQVTAQLGKGLRIRSPVMQFIFDFEPPEPTVPENHIVLSRRDASVAEDGGILFTWEKTNFTEGYVLEIARDEDFEHKIYEKTLKENFLIYTGLRPGRYWWRVKGFSRKFFSRTSEPFELVVEP